MSQEKKERIFISYKRVDKERVFAIPRTLTDIHPDAFPAHTTVRRSLLW